MKFALAAIVAALGIALALYAGQDDSPGGVLMGFALIIGAIVIGVWAIRSHRRVT